MNTPRVSDERVANIIAMGRPTGSPTLADDLAKDLQDCRRGLKDITGMIKDTIIDFDYVWDTRKKYGWAGE